MNSDFKHIKTIYFIGIGGIGMSALAFHFLKLNKSVLGYDRIESDVSKQLKEKGALIEYDTNLELAKKIPPQNSLVIFTPAIKSNHPVYEYFNKNGYTLHKRAKILGDLSKEKTCIAVAGTHGKTTISTMLAFLLKENNEPVTGFLGGVSEDYNTNYIENGNDIFVMEADEYDRSLLQLYPDYVAISNIDEDHLDIYKDKSDLEHTFKSFAQKTDQNRLFHLSGLNFNGNKIGLNSDANIYASDIIIKNGTYHFDWVYFNQKIKDVKLNIPGRHNVLNALFALSLAVVINPSKILSFAKTIEQFRGIKRRFNYIVKQDELVIIDDYAHHPSEIRAIYDAVREMYPKDKIMAIFQPHLFSRTSDFADDFAIELSKFDSIKLLEIYAAREEPIKGITSNFLCQKMTNPRKEVISKQDILHTIRTSNCRINVMMGAGDIGVESNRLKQYYNP